jgi:hypothetical protein
MAGQLLRGRMVHAAAFVGYVLPAQARLVDDVCLALNLLNPLVRRHQSHAINKKLARACCRRCSSLAPRGLARRRLSGVRSA